MVAGIAAAFGGINGGTEVQQFVHDALAAVPGLALGGNSAHPEAPAAYLNYLLFDGDMVLLDMGHRPVTGAGLFARERLLFDPIEVKESGFAYIYVSYEGLQARGRVFFDDLEIVHREGPVVQADDYYPFGMTFNSYRRAKGRENRYLYNGFEKQTALDWDVFDYQARYYDPATGRFLNVDPAAGLMRRHSPYNYAFDNPIRFIDPDGMMPSNVNCCGGLLQAGREFLNGASNAFLSNATTFGTPAGDVFVGVERNHPRTTAEAFGQTAGDALSVVTGAVEVIVGGGAAAGGTVGGVVTAPTGVGAVAGAATATAGVAVAGHGVNTVKNALEGMLFSSGSGRGSNNRVPDDEATGDHTVINENGTTTYKVNENNPNTNSQGVGFETVKRVDRQGGAHRNRVTGEKIPTPHVHEKSTLGEIRPAVPGEDIPKERSQQ